LMSSQKLEMVVMSFRSTFLIHSFSFLNNMRCYTLAVFRWGCKIFGSTVTLSFLFGN
jgi:hypothetical protein